MHIRNKGVIDTSGAARIGGMGQRVDVANGAGVQRLVQAAAHAFGQVGLLCSNAGVRVRRDEDAPNAEWQRHWDLNELAHVCAARAVLPQRLVRGEGYLLQTVSAPAAVHADRLGEGATLPE